MNSAGLPIIFATLSQRKYTVRVTPTTTRGNGPLLVEHEVVILTGSSPNVPDYPSMPSRRESSGTNCCIPDCSLPTRSPIDGLIFEESTMLTCAASLLITLKTVGERLTCSGNTSSRIDVHSMNRLIGAGGLPPAKDLVGCRGFSRGDDSYPHRV
jgi:hypothetical protein